MIITPTTSFLSLRDNRYPLTLETIRKENPRISFGSGVTREFFTTLGYAPVQETPLPTGDVVAEGPPMLVEGTYTQTWDVRGYNEEELQALLTIKKKELSSRVSELLDEELAIGAPIDFGEGYGVLHLQMRPEDRINITGLKQAADEAIRLGYPEKMYYVRMYENINVPIKATDLVQIAWEYMGTFMTVVGHSWALKDAIAAATTMEELPTLPERLQVG